MLVSDLTHFLDMPDDVPAPAQRLAQHVAGIVRAATAGGAGQWTSALPCRRRPRHQPCPGRIAVATGPAPAPIRWNCSACDDEGVISNWEGSIYDLRPQRLAAVPDTLHEIVLSDDVAATLRELTFLDPDCERLVFAMRSHRHGAALYISAEDLEELIGAVAAEANHEPHRRRQRRLDDAFDALETAARRLPPDPVTGHRR